MKCNIIYNLSYCVHEIPEPGGLSKFGQYKKKLITDSSKKSLVQKSKLASPQYQHFYKEHQKAKRQSDFSVRAKKAVIMSKSKIFEKLTRKLNLLAKKFFWLQIQQSTKCRSGRRYSDEEKLIALSIFKQSPKSYKFLQKIFVLPSKCTINRMIQNVCIETGINAQIFASLKKEKKYCSIIFDELAVEPALYYDNYKDNISGFIEFYKKVPEFADHGLVFMIRGAVYRWQQPICFYFCQGSTRAIYLKAIIEKVTLELIRAGLFPVAFINDTIKIQAHNMNVIFDPPHLMKGLRNNFLTKDIILDGKISKWRDIIDVYLTDCKQTEIRLLHKLNDEHVIPEKNKKMKVNY
ncbi:hypothetical protein K1T71_015021 [Dendrolimus kikuchii]|nr:hypothetical protein K1T71_015021 [Dendrolimus kikuchii]